MNKETILALIKKYGIYIFTIFLIIIILLLLITNNKVNDSPIIEESPILKENIDNKEIKEIKKIKIDIKGQIKRPGVYEFNVNSRVVDAIKKSGGLTKNGDTSVINLSKKLEDEMIIIIYSKKQVEQLKTGKIGIKYIEKKCVCPDTTNDACIKNNINNDTVITSNKTSQEVSKETSSKISLNNATLEQLQTLSGIGESKAKSIIEYRNTNGGFKTIEELKKVSGIGEATYEKLKANITL